MFNSPNMLRAISVTVISTIYLLGRFPNVFGCEYGPLQMVAVGEETALLSLRQPVSTFENCSWIISPQNTDQRVRLKLTTLTMEYSSTCLKGFLEIFDGPSPDSPSLGKWCEHVTHVHSVTVTSSGPSLFILYQAQPSSFSSGFESAYTSVVVTERFLTWWQLVLIGVGALVVTVLLIIVGHHIRYGACTRDELE